MWTTEGGRVGGMLAVTRGVKGMYARGMGREGYIVNVDEAWDEGYIALPHPGSKGGAREPDARRVGELVGEFTHVERCMLCYTLHLLDENAVTHTGSKDGEEDGRLYSVAC